MTSVSLLIVRHESDVCETKMHVCTKKSDMRLRQYQLLAGLFVGPLLISIACQGILSQTKRRAIFWIPTVCHSRPQRERERERCVFSERGHTNSAIVYLSIHCPPLPLKCNLICIQINHFSPIIFYRGSLLTVSICIFCTTCACVDLCKIMMVRDFLRFQFWLTFN